VERSAALTRCSRIAFLSCPVKQTLLRATSRILISHADLSHLSSIFRGYFIKLVSRSRGAKGVRRRKRKRKRESSGIVVKFRRGCPRKKASSADSRVRCGKCIIEGCVCIRREKGRPAPHRRAGSSSIYLTRPLNILCSAIHSEYSPVMPIVVALPGSSGYTGCR